jgi:large subunit ribosomal protein L25
MELVKVVAARREVKGKNVSRRLRGSGQIPAVAYGKGEAAISLSVSPKDLVGVLGTPHGRNSVIELDVEGKDKFSVLLCDFQYHPVTRVLLHADFLKIALDKPVEVDVPLELTGKPKGLIDGGVLRQVFRKLPVSCLPKDIPVNVVHDVTELELDDHVGVRDLSLPEGVTVRLPPEQTVAAVVTEKKVIEEEAVAAAVPGAEGAAAAAPGAAPAAGAPAEGAKPESK